MSEEEDRIVKVLMKFLELKEEDRDRILRIVRENHPKKIMIALENAYLLTRKGKVKARVSLEEFEEMLKRVRW